MAPGVEQWVDFHLNQLERLPVSPPYSLAGFSFGGVFALELARRLQDAGQEVVYLAMVDTVRPKLNPIGLSRYVELHVRELLDLPAEKRANYVRRTARISWSRTKSRARRRSLRTARRLGLLSEAPTTLGDVKGMRPLVRGREPGARGRRHQPALGALPARRVRQPSDRRRPPADLRRPQRRLRRRCVDPQPDDRPRAPGLAAVTGLLGLTLQPPSDRSDVRPVVDAALAVCYVTARSRGDLLRREPRATAEPIKRKRAVLAIRVGLADSVIERAAYGGYAWSSSMW